MEKKKSDTRRFLETMWIMAKYDVLPWMIGAGIVALVTIGLYDAKAQNTINKDAASKTVFQKQR